MQKTYKPTNGGTGTCINTDVKLAGAGFSPRAQVQFTQSRPRLPWNCGRANLYPAMRPSSATPTSRWQQQAYANEAYRSSKIVLLAVRDTCTYSNRIESKYERGASGCSIGYGLYYCDLFGAASFSTTQSETCVLDSVLYLPTFFVPYATYELISRSELKHAGFGSRLAC